MTILAIIPSWMALSSATDIESLLRDPTSKYPHFFVGTL